MKGIGVGEFKSVVTSTAYQQSFGALDNGTCYSDGFKNIDIREDLQTLINAGLETVQMKAYGTTSATAGGPGTAGVAMIPVYVDPRIVDTTRKYTPLVELIPRVTNMGVTADFNKITAKGSAVVKAEDAALPEQDDSLDRASVPMKYLYAVGRVTGQARAAYPSYILEGFQATGAGLAGTAFSPNAAPNAKQLAVIIKARAIRELEEELIVNGDIGADANEFDGIVDEMADVNEVDRNTAALRYADVETAIQYAFDDGGRPNLAVASSSVLTDLRKLMIDTFRYRPVDMVTELPFGISSHLTLETMVGPVPVIPSMNLSNVSGSKGIYFLDMGYIEMRVLQDMTYEDMAHTNDSEKFMLKIYEGLVMKNPAFNAQINEISA